jgi:capsular polysaccharide transport system permease protein
MKDDIAQARLIHAGPKQARALSTLRRHWVLAAAIAATLLATLYWGLIASDRYVSEARVVVQQADMGADSVGTLPGILGSLGGGGQKDEQVLQNYLLSNDLLRKLDAKLHLREHYSDPRYDILSRMWSRDEPWEWFANYFRSRVSVSLDDTSGVLDISVQAYTKEMAQAIVAMMVTEGERFMNDMMHRLAQDQVAFLEKQVSDLGQRTARANQALLDFQNKNRLVSPQSTAENLVGIVNRLEGQLADLRTQRSAMLGYLAPGSPAIVDLDLQIEALEKQMAKEQARLTAPKGGTLNNIVEQYQRLQMTADFNQDLYKTALTVLEKGRTDAARMLKKVAIIQAPTLPDYPLEPRRLYNIIVFMLTALLIAGIVNLMAAIIRDHKD